MTEVLYGLDVAERQRVDRLLDERRFFWLDVSLSETSRADVVDVLAMPGGAARALGTLDEVSGARRLHADDESLVFGFRVFVERSTEAGRAASGLDPVAIHVVVTGDYLLTLHEERVSLPAALGVELPQDRNRLYVVYAVVDAMLASTFQALEEVELELDAIAAAWTDGSSERLPRATLRKAGARLATMRRGVAAEQAVVERVGVEIKALPGFDPDSEHYFDRLDEQAGRLLDAIDAATSAMGTLLSLQLNQRAYVLSIVGTIFVPLTFVTGFFGMNFGWMVDHIGSAIAFWLLGITIPLVTAVLAWRLLVRRFVTG